MSIKVYSTRWCPDCIRTRRILSKYRVAFEEVNIDHDPAAGELVTTLNQGFRSVPTLVFPDGSTLTEPKGPELLDKLRVLGFLTG